MNLDLQIEGKYSQRTEDLQHLKEIHAEYEAPLDPPNGYAVAILKAFIAIIAIFFSSAAVISMDPDIAFISVTLILITCGTVLAGAEKIITLFPERIWSAPQTRNGSSIKDQGEE